mmetsp:Transcript_1240/g.5267  ORF Transcript_1240/g.5267 Transcript_1240/m.5267 type:complete len:328 (+) Transcript_1240:2080-3063(+)
MRKEVPHHEGAADVATTLQLHRLHYSFARFGEGLRGKRGVVAHRRRAQHHSPQQWLAAMHAPAVEHVVGQNLHVQEKRLIRRPVSAELHEMPVRDRKLLHHVWKRMASSSRQGADVLLLRLAAGLAAGLVAIYIVGDCLQVAKANVRGNARVRRFSAKLGEIWPCTQLPQGLLRHGFTGGPSRLVCFHPGEESFFMQLGRWQRGVQLEHHLPSPCEHTQHACELSRAGVSVETQGFGHRRHVSVDAVNDKALADLALEVAVEQEWLHERVAAQQLLQVRRVRREADRLQGLCKGGASSRGHQEHFRCREGPGGAEVQQLPERQHLGA